MCKKLEKRLILKEISRFYWSEWGDSNSRHLEPKSSALPTGPHPDTDGIIHDLSGECKGKMFARENKKCLQFILYFFRKYDKIKKILKKKEE